MAFGALQRCRECISDARGEEGRHMAKVEVFTSFDCDHDEDLRNLLVG